MAVVLMSWLLLVVVNDLDVFRAGGCPPQADAPLLVDPDAVLAGPSAAQLLQPITRWDPHVFEGVRGI
jgi:hypothetical protein